MDENFTVNEGIGKVGVWTEGNPLASGVYCEIIHQHWSCLHTFCHLLPAQWTIEIRLKLQKYFLLILLLIIVLVNYKLCISFMLFFIKCIGSLLIFLKHFMLYSNIKTFNN